MLLCLRWCYNPLGSCTLQRPVHCPNTIPNSRLSLPICVTVHYADTPQSFGLILCHCEKCDWKTSKSCRCTVYHKNRRSPKNDSGRGENRPRCGCCGERRMKSTWRGEQKKASGRLFLLILGSKRAFSSHFESFLRSFSG